MNLKKQQNSAKLIKGKNTVIMILTVGKQSSDEFKSIIDDYVKRIKIKMDIRIKYIKDYGHLKEKRNEIIKKESDELLKNIEKNNFNILLDITGKMLDSYKFNELMLNANKDIVFIVGGIFGVDERVKKQCNEIVSFSKMTFTHKIARILLVEQIYRSMEIRKGGKYHK